MRQTIRAEAAIARLDPVELLVVQCVERSVASDSRSDTVQRVGAAPTVVPRRPWAVRIQRGHPFQQSPRALRPR